MEDVPMKSGEFPNKILTLRRNRKDLGRVSQDD